MSLPPRTYAAWAEQLDLCGRGDDAVLELLAQGHWQPDAGTAQRFANLVNTAYTARKQRWLNAFSRSQAAGPAVRSPQDFSLHLRQATANLQPLHRLAGLPALPADLRATLQADLHAFVQDVGASLRENILQHGGNRREELLLTLRSFGTLSAPPAGTPSPAPASTSRRIIF